MKNWNPEKIFNILLSCGKIAMGYYDNPGYELKNDKSIVTDADRAIEKYLSESFDDPDNNVYMVGEETIHSRSEDYISKALTETAWIVDPIDGTAPYSHHIPTWGISIAFMSNGIIKEGAIYLPVIGEIYISDNKKVLFKDKMFQNNEHVFSELKEFTVNKKAANRSLISITQEVTKFSTMKLTNPVQSICSAVFSLTQLLQRRYMAYILSPHIKIWDFAAGLLLLKNTDFITRYRDGMDLDLNIQNLCRINRNGINKWKLNREAIFTTSDN